MIFRISYKTEREDSVKHYMNFFMRKTNMKSILFIQFYSGGRSFVLSIDNNTDIFQSSEQYRRLRRMGLCEV